MENSCGCLKKKLSLNKYLKIRKTFLITRKDNPSKILAYKKLGYKFIFIDKLKCKNDFILLCKKIYEIGYSRMLVEAGLTFLNSLIKNKMIHDLYIFKTHGKNSNSLFKK